MQQVDGILGGKGILKTQPTPAPLTPPKREGLPLSNETAAIAAEDKRLAESEEK